MSKRLGFFKRLSAGIAVCLMICGCNTAADLVVHDELFTYEMTYDKVFLFALDAIEKTEEWDLVMTNKDEGVIKVRAKDFMNDDEVKVVIKRIEKGKTSLELAKDSQRIRGVETLLKAIDQLLLMK